MPTAVYEGAEAMRRLSRMVLLQAAGLADAQHGTEIHRARAEAEADRDVPLMEDDRWRLEQSARDGSMHPASSTPSTYVAHVVVRVPGLPKRYCGWAEGREAAKKQVRFLYFLRKLGR